MASWLWPDHVISKRESRRLREEHNRLNNAAYDALQAMRDTKLELKQMHAHYIKDKCAPGDCPTTQAIANLDKAINAITKG